MARISAHLLFVLLGLSLAAGCSTIIKPTKPSTPLSSGPTAAGFSFAGENVTIRQPGLPMTESRSWHTEVENYTARSLNKVLDTDPAAPVADTVASFDLAGRSAIQVGTWMEMTVTMRTRLPDGRIVRSEPMSRNIDTMFEQVASTGAEIGGYALDATASIATFIWFFTRDQLACYTAVGALAAGLCLNVSQPGIDSLIAASEETRWSDLYAEALTAHANDIREAIGEAAVGPAPIVAPMTPPTNNRPIAPTKEPVKAKDPEVPPPPLLGPADPRDPAGQGF